MHEQGERHCVSLQLFCLFLIDRSLFSTRDDDYAICAGSPFPREHLKILVARDVSSKYTRRDITEYARMAEYILHMVSGKKGKLYGIFPIPTVCWRIFMKLLQNGQRGQGLRLPASVRQRA